MAWIFPIISGYAVYKLLTTKTKIVPLPTDDIIPLPKDKPKKVKKDDK